MPLASRSPAKLSTPILAVAAAISGLLVCGAQDEAKPDAPPYFGQTIGAIVDLPSSQPETKPGEIEIPFTPVRPIAGLTKYEIAVTPSTHRIFRIKATGVGNDQEQFNAICEALIRDYGALKPFAISRNPNDQGFVQPFKDGRLMVARKEDGYCWATAVDYRLQDEGKKEVADRAQPITGAFGLKLGERMEAGPAGADESQPDRITVPVDPPDASSLFTRFQVELCPPNRKVMNIVGFGPMLDRVGLDRLVGELESKYGKFHWHTSGHYFFTNVRGNSITLWNDEKVGLKFSAGQNDLFWEARRYAREEARKKGLFDTRFE